MALQVQELIQKNYVSELLAKDARLKFLENQINPHFLYNTLESINSYAKSMDAEAYFPDGRGIGIFAEDYFKP